MSPDEPLSAQECELLLIARRNGDIGAAEWMRLVRATPSLAAFVRAIESREQTGAVLKRCGYRVN